ncbi:hypothetical protein ACFLY0_01170 [Patescibacteria group bacterium]
MKKNRREVLSLAILFADEAAREICPERSTGAIPHLAEELVSWEKKHGKPYLNKKCVTVDHFITFITSSVQKREVTQELSKTEQRQIGLIISMYQISRKRFILCTIQRSVDDLVKRFGAEEHVAKKFLKDIIDHILDHELKDVEAN